MRNTQILYWRLDIVGCIFTTLGLYVVFMGHDLLGKSVSHCCLLGDIDNAGIHSGAALNYHTYSYIINNYNVNTFYLADPDKSYIKLPVRIASIISSEFFSYCTADIFCTSDSLIAFPIGSD